MTNNARPQALLIQLEFPTWQAARPWTYCANFAIREGLEANGVECHTIPAIPRSSTTATADWLRHADRLCNGKHFDQVWVWLVHYEYDQRLLEWMASLAPVRVGYVMESLSYSEEEHRFSPITRQRKTVVERQLPYLTHVVVCDELDSREFNETGRVKSFWCPAFVPKRFIVQQTGPAMWKKAAFHGTLYGHRKEWLEYPPLKQHMVVPPSNNAAEIHQAFDQLHLFSAQALKNRPDDAESLCRQYVTNLQRIRLAEFSRWMKDLAQWACVVNLPGFQKGYGGRVYEAMAAGRPVISWDIPNRPNNRALFQDGEDILLFPPHEPDILAGHISHVLDDPDFAARLTRNAYRKMITQHSAETRLRHILQWLELGIEPAFGAGSADRTDAKKRPDTVSLSASPAVSIIIPCYNQAQFLHEAVDSVINQQYGSWECIIVDDGSPDQTAAVAQRIVSQYPDKQIRLIRKANGGLADARNAGIQEARGRYILPLDADDRLHPEYLKDTVAVLEQKQDIAIVYVDEQNFGETTHVHRKGVSDLTNLLHGNVHDYCSLYRRSVWEMIGGYSPAMYIGAEDWNFWIAAAKRGLRSFHVGKPLFLYRNRAGTMVEQVKANVEVVKALLIMHHPDLFTEAGLAQAKMVLSKLSSSNKEKLAHAYAVHPKNELLKTFSRLACSSAATAEDIQGKDVGSIMRSQDAAFIPTPMEPHDKGHCHDEAYYTDLFVKNPEWSAAGPNNDETSRWVQIASFLEHIVRAKRKTGCARRLRILDLGCGRGWLTNLASAYGECTGVEPVAAVVAHARKLFPHLQFHVGMADALLADPGFEPFDIVLSSEVIEHVPRSHQAEFVQRIRRLIKPNGHVILTTPRGEVFDLWKEVAPPNQPIEDWLLEEDVRRLFIDNQFVRLGTERVWIELPTFRFLPAPTPADHGARRLIPFYQVWAWQAPSEQGGLASTRPLTPPPMVSVVVPTYDRPDRLAGALASVAGQTYQDFEIVVVNDGGCDVESIVASVNDDRITYIRHDRNRGLAAARNTGLRAAKGKYIAYLDDDDRYLPHHLETLVTLLEAGEFKAAYTDAWRVHERQVNGQYVEVRRDVPYSYEFNPADLLVSNYFPVLSVMHARQCLDEVGLFDESLFAHEDWDLWIRMATRFPFKHVAITTAEFTWRSDGSSMTSGTRDTYRRTTEIIYHKYAPYAERIAGVRDAQRRRLEEFRAESGAKSYVCSIIMPVWNRLGMTRECLTALSQLKDQPEFELIVVDNGSADGTAEFLAQLGGDVRIVTNADNEGFAKACNQGAAIAKGTYLVFLNNDTVPQQGWLGALVAEVESHPEVGVVGSKLLYPDGTIQHAGIVRDSQHLLPYHIYKSFAGDDPAVNQRREFQIVTAACLLIRRSLFKEVGGFDEGYVNGFEDADLCLKVRERGSLVVYQPRSVVVHLESQTPGRKAHEEANAARFLARWGEQWWAVDEDRHFHADGYKLKRIFRNGQLGGDIQLIDDFRDRASWAHVAAAQAAALKKDWAVVRWELQRVDDWPNDRFVLSWGAIVAERLQELVCRSQFMSRYLALVDTPTERVALVRMLLEQRNLLSAEEHLRVLLSSSPDHAEGLLLSGVLCMQREQYLEAEEAFASALQQGADRRKCLMGIGMASLGRAYAQGAWVRFLQVLGEHPDDAEAVHWLLRAGTAQNRWEELSRHLRGYVSRNPGDLAVRFALAGVLVRADRIDEARREHDALKAIAPEYDGLAELGRAIAGKETVLAMEAAEMENDQRSRTVEDPVKVAFTCGAMDTWHEKG